LDYSVAGESLVLTNPGSIVQFDRMATPFGAASFNGFETFLI
jgi:hypothetical protein